MSYGNEHDMSPKPTHTRAAMEAARELIFPADLSESIEKVQQEAQSKVWSRHAHAASRIDRRFAALVKFAEEWAADPCKVVEAWEVEMQNWNAFHFGPGSPPPKPSECGEHKCITCGAREALRAVKGD